MTYTPSTSEIEISGLTISSGGQNWAGFTAIVPLQASNPSQFYVKDINGNLTKVDVTTAAQLYATTVAINNLSKLYDKDDVADTAALEWQPAIDQIVSEIPQQNLLTLVESMVTEVPDMLPEAAGLAVPGADFFAAAALVENIVTTTQEIRSSSKATDLKLALGVKFLQNASSLLNQRRPWRHVRGRSARR